MNRWVRYGILAGVITIHLVLLVTVSITTRVQEEREDTTVFKLVDVSEFVPPPPEDPEPLPPVENAPVVSDGPAEIVIESETELPPVTSAPAEATAVIEYLPQHRISKAPVVPTDQVLGAIDYPPLANRQGIEGVVYLELFVDATGAIRRIDILRDPGYGLGEAAVAAFTGILCTPAESNGVPVAVRYRYPVRFSLR